MFWTGVLIGATLTLGVVSLVLSVMSRRALRDIEGPARRPADTAGRLPRAPS